MFYSPTGMKTTQKIFIYIKAYVSMFVSTLFSAIHRNFQAWIIVLLCLKNKVTLMRICFLIVYQLNHIYS